MKHVDFYQLFFKPGSNGQIIFHLVGEHESRVIKSIPPLDFVALSTVLAQKQLGFDTERGVFTSTDTDQELQDEILQ